MYTINVTLLTPFCILVNFPRVRLQYMPCKFSIDMPFVNVDNLLVLCVKKMRKMSNYSAFYNILIAPCFNSVKLVKYSTGTLLTNYDNFAKCVTKMEPGIPIWLHIINVKFSNLIK